MGKTCNKELHSLTRFCVSLLDQPVNTPDTIVDPSRWQPAVTNKAGIVSIQSFVTPQHGLTKAYAFDDVTQFRAKPHGRLLVGPKGYELYKNTTDEVIKVSAQLTEEQKVSKFEPQR